ncbi:hypothetical protein TNCV_853841 [Trichonephila clavipes]|nr:hypothetical protein TNCV_853841 [Trichonephila clavipes]
MEGKSCVSAEDDVVTAVGIFVLRLDDSGAILKVDRHILESDEWGCKQLIHLGSRLQSVEACPTDAHLEQYPALMADGNLGLLKVRIKFLVGKRDASFFIVILLTWVTPWSESPSKISDLEEDKRSGSEMTPRHEFNELRGVTVKGKSKKVLANKNDLLCNADVVSIILWTTKGDFRAISLFGNDKIKKREHLATLSINRLGNSGHEFKESMGRAS